MSSLAEWAFLEDLARSLDGIVANSVHLGARATKWGQELPND